MYYKRKYRLPSARDLLRAVERSCCASRWVAYWADPTFESGQGGKSLMQQQPKDPPSWSQALADRYPAAG